MAIAAQLPDDAVLVGLTSIYWRESWRYGERAFRYCQHDVGHAIGSVAVSAAGLVWEAKLLESVIDSDLAALLGVDVQEGMEAEHADCLLAVSSSRASLTLDEQRAFTIPAAVRDELRGAGWLGAPNVSVTIIMRGQSSTTCRWPREDRAPGRDVLVPQRPR